MVGHRNASRDLKQIAFFKRKVENLALFLSVKMSRNDKPVLVFVVEPINKLNLERAWSLKSNLFISGVFQNIIRTFSSRRVRKSLVELIVLLNKNLHCQDFQRLVVVVVKVVHK